MMSFDRRNFLKYGIGFGLLGSIPLGAERLGWTLAADALAADAKSADEEAAEKIAEAEKRLQFQRVEIALGAKKPFRTLHLSDTHLCLADERENERKRTLAKNRRRYFSEGELFLDAALSYAKRTGETLLYTGDLIDFVSEANLDAIAAKFQNADVFGSSGNHEFSQYVGEAKEDDAYKAQSFDRVQKAFPNDLVFASRIIEGVNFVAFDDVYYNITARQKALFEAEAAKGLPIVALCHCPLYTPELYDVAMSEPGATCSYLVGVPDERTAGYEAHRRDQQKRDNPTADFLDYLKKQPLLKAILSGHLHYDWVGPFSETATQYVVAGNFQGHVREFTFV